MAGEEVGSLYYDLNIDDKRLKGQLDDADKAVKNFGDSVSRQWDKSVDASKRFMTGLAAVSAGVVAFGVKSVQAFRESEQVMAQTQAVLKSTGYAAGVTTGEITRLAKELQKSSKFTDEEVQSAQNLLLTFTKIGKDVFPDATKTVVDMSAALGQDLKSSSIQLGKALNDPIQGVNALKRVGVSFNDQQLQQIETLVKSGKQLEAQKLILKELQVEFGGSAKAASDAAGPMERIKDVWSDSQEVIGGLISRAIDPLISRLGSWLEKVDEAKIEQFVDNVFGWLKTNGDSLAGIIGGALAPALLSLAFSFGMLFLRLAPFMALGFLIANFDELLNSFRELNPLVQAAIYLVGAFAGILGGIFVANIAKAALATSTQLGGAIKGVGLLFKALSATIASPLVMPALVVAAALASLKLVQDALRSISDAVDAVNASASAAANLAPEGQMRQLQKKAAEARARGDSAAVKRYANAIAALGGGTASFAKGVTNFAGGLAYVHQGELLVNMPKGTNVIPKKEVDKVGGGNTINIHIDNINDRRDADYLLNEIDRRQERLAMGLSA